jgi:hypothetical protein
MDEKGGKHAGEVRRLRVAAIKLPDFFPVQIRPDLTGLANRMHACNCMIAIGCQVSARTAARSISAKAMPASS